MKTKPDTTINQELIEIQIGFPQSLDPALLEETAGKEITDNVYERLVFYSENSINSFMPMLAESWTVSPNGLEYTFNLRKGVKFHNGECVYAYAVRASLIRMLRVSRNGAAIFSPFIDENSFLVVNPYTITIKLKKAFAGFLHLIALQEASIICPTAFNGAESDGGISDNSWLKTNMIGTGPYKLQEYNPQDRKIVLIRNENYWRTPAKLLKVTIQYINEFERRKELFLNNQADIAPFQARNLSEIEGKPGVVISSNQSLDIMVFGLNIHNGYLRNLNFRFAISHCFDYERYLKEIRRNYGLRISGAIPKGLFGHSDSLPRFEQDLVLAEKYLSQSKINLEEIPHLKIIYPEGLEDREAGCNLLSDNLKSVGIKSFVESFEWLTFIEKCNRGDYDIAFLSWAPDYPDPDNYIYHFFHSKGQFSEIIRLVNSTVDSLIEQAQVEQNPEVREKLYFQIQQKMVQEAVYLWVYQSIDLKVLKECVRGLRYHPLYSDYYFYSLSKSI